MLQKKVFKISLSSKGQVVLPLLVRQQLGLTKQSRLLVTVSGKQIILQPKIAVAEKGFGSFAEVGKSSIDLLKTARDEEEKLSFKKS